MKRMINNAVHPWKTKYSVHTISDNGRDILLGGSNNINEAQDIARRQALDYFESPWETNERKFKFLQDMYVCEDATEKDVTSIDTEDYIDSLMSELDSRIKSKSITSSSDVAKTSQCSIDFINDGLYDYKKLGNSIHEAFIRAGVYPVGIDFREVDYSDYPEYKNELTSQCAVDFAWYSDYDENKIEEEVQRAFANYAGYELIGIDFYSISD